MAAANWKPPPRPSGRTLAGKYVRLEKADFAKHRCDLRSALLGPDADPHQWDYLLEGPFTSDEEFDDYLKTTAQCKDPFAFAVVNLRTNKAEGLISFWAIEPGHASIQIGSLTFGACMQRSPKSTEAVYLMIKEAFGLGYRRVGWCCHSGNERSKNAALRYGFVYEGTARNQRVPKGRNRDGCFFSMTNAEWPHASKAFEEWLSDANQGPQGQVVRLSELVCKALGRTGPPTPEFPAVNWEELPNWQGARCPSATTMQGRFVQIEKFDPSIHADVLTTIAGNEVAPIQVTPRDDVASQRFGSSQLYAICDLQNAEVKAFIRLVGVRPEHGRVNVELVPHAFFASDHPQAHEAVYLMLKELFSLGFRRVSMTVDCEDPTYNQAARQLRFTYELTHRQGTVVDGSSRDLAVYSVISDEWPQVKAEYEKHITLG